MHDRRGGYGDGRCKGLKWSHGGARCDRNTERQCADGTGATVAKQMVDGGGGGGGGSLSCMAVVV